MAGVPGSEPSARGVEGVHDVAPALADLADEHVAGYSHVVEIRVVLPPAAQVWQGGKRDPWQCQIHAEDAEPLVAGRLKIGAGGQIQHVRPVPPGRIGLLAVDDPLVTVANGTS